MTTITISRQMGSLGTEVARLAASRLGYKLAWREVIDLAARQAGTPEVALATIDELGLLGLRPSIKAKQAYHQAVQQVMTKMATEGNIVIVGRAGQVILGGFPNSLHVRVIAPLSIRIERISRSCEIKSESAQARIEASDRYRANYLRYAYHARWNDPELYDLIINTGRIAPAEAAEIIYQSAINLEKTFHI